MWGVPVVPRDVDLVPALGAANLARLAGVLLHWRARPALEPAIGWSPLPASEANLDHLMRSRRGLVDVVPRIAGSYEELIDAAAPLVVAGRLVRFAAPGALLATLRPGTPKHRGRVAPLVAAAATGRPPWWGLTPRPGT